MEPGSHSISSTSAWRITVIPAQAGIQKCLQKRGAMMEKQAAVYLLASQRNGTLYIGVTSNLVKRIWEHQNNAVEGFTKRYDVHTLVYYEQHATMEAAITREKQLKKWNRAWKLRLVEERNPDWRDLWPEIVG